MITVRLTDGQSAIPFSCENFIALRHGCRRAFHYFSANKPLPLPDHLILHVLDQYGNLSFDPDGVAGYWIAAGDYCLPENYHERCGSNIIIWRRRIGSDIYPDNQIALISPISDWHRIWSKCLAADNHAHQLAVFGAHLADQAAQIMQPKKGSPNRAKFYFIAGGKKIT